MTKYWTRHGASKYKHHRKSFWKFLSQLLGEDAQLQNKALNVTERKTTATATSR